MENYEVTDAIKEKYKGVNKVYFRNRGSKKYITVLLYANHRSTTTLIDIKNFLKDFFPNIYITSGSASSMTFRTNADSSFG